MIWKWATGHFWFNVSPKQLLVVRLLIHTYRNNTVMSLMFNFWLTLFKTVPSPIYAFDDESH